GGPEAASIVCGAPNVAAGQTVAVAPVGCTLPGGLAIKKAKLRGVPSHGMICSERELGLSEDHSGILVLDQPFRPGVPLTEALQLERCVLDFDITPNRADCLSILGMAREAAMAFDLPLTLPKFELRESAERADAAMRIEIDDPELCPMYLGRVLTGVKIGPSPAWMRYRLLAVGQRPISNVVDVTNYCMFELGQPEHAFDLDLLRDGVIRVGLARDGQELVTLDGQTRKLTAADLLINDGQGAVALAGVMGGQSTEVHDGTKNVFLESAVFRPGTIRRTARRLALPSEASYRFERGVDQSLTRFVVDRAAQLMAETAGATVLSGVAASEPKPWVRRVHGFRLDRCNRLLGLELTPEFCKKTFTLMGCIVDDADAADWQVESPSHRLDLEREVDLYEEVGRVHGLDRIPAVLPRIARTFDTPQTDDTVWGFVRRIKFWGLGAGLHEAINYSFTGTTDLDGLGLPAEGRVMVANPLSEDQNVMRTALAPGLLNSLKNNLSKGNTRLRLFEVAKTFHADPASDTQTREANRLGVLLYGNRHAEDWPWPKEGVDYLDLKGLIEHLLGSLKLPAAEFEAATGHAYLEPVVRVRIGETVLGELGMVRAAQAEPYHARTPVWMAELDVDALRALVMGRRVTFAPLPVYPPVRRDVTFVAPAGLPAGRMEAAIRQAAAGKGSIFESVALVAVFQPEAEAEVRNVSFRITYRHPERTLKDKDVDKQHAAILAKVCAELPVTAQTGGAEE
ncbi:MAG: phenylalanine--tRNA ligase subunit beta, partial [Desulfovibrionaceae bacterium]